MIFTPASEAEAAGIVRDARARGRTLRIEGGGTRSGLGAPVTADDVLSSRGLSGITVYEPAELVISAKAGTPLEEVETALAGNGQMLPFEPFDHRPLYGTSGQPTVGGLFATAAHGSRRISAGAVRDLALGVRFVNGFGDVVKSGGRVMKNVTGLDLVKLQCGARGTLGFVTEVTFKVLPRPETTATLVIHDRDDDSAIRLLGQALASPFGVSGAAHRPARGGQAAQTLVRLEGFSQSVAYRIEALQALLSGGDVLGELPSCELWRDLSGARFLDVVKDAAIWRLSVPPRDGASIVQRVGAAMPLHAHSYDWGGGLVWLATHAQGDCGAAVLHAAVGTHGHATLVRAPQAVSAAADVRRPQPPGLTALTERIRASFDPAGLFNSAPRDM